jgi:cyanate permease
MTSEADPAEVTVVEPVWWAELPPVEKARIWEKVAPGSAAKILEQTDRQVQHVRRMAWARLCLSVFTAASALATVVLFVWLAKYYVDHGAPTQGAAIIGALAAVVTAFVGGRILSDRRASEGTEEAQESGRKK